MTAEELWERSGLSGTYEAWSFGEAPDKLAHLVEQGIKTATCSAYDLYEANHEPLPKAGDYSIILNSCGEAVCIIRTVKVYVTPFNKVSEEHAFKEGEGDRSLEYWRMVHENFLTNELASLHQSFDENTKVVCEEFEVVALINEKKDPASGPYMNFSKIHSSEIDALWNLQKQYKAEIGEEEPDSDGKERLSDAIDKGTICFYGAWNDTALIACCSVTVGFSTFDYLPGGVFEDFYIRPEYRHQGIARQLVEFAYRESGVSSLTVGCADCDVKMYQSLGFSIPLGNLLAFSEPSM